MQGNVLRIRNLFCIGNLLVMRFAWVGLAQVRYPFALGGCNDDVLVAMDFSLAAVVQSLFFSLFRSLAASFRAVNNGIYCVRLVLFLGFELLGVALGRRTHILQGLFQDWQKLVDPLVGSTLRHPKQLALHGL